ncbi:hypothetical protein YC2023_044415 [Brassica napus]
MRMVQRESDVGTQVEKKGNCKIVSLSLTTAMEFWRRKKEKGKARKWFLRNGSKFLEQLIADNNGMSNPIRMFSSYQISKAINHFDPKYSLPDIPSPLPGTRESSKADLT